MRTNPSLAELRNPKLKPTVTDEYCSVHLEENLIIDSKLSRQRRYTPTLGKLAGLPEDEAYCERCLWLENNLSLE